MANFRYGVCFTQPEYEFLEDDFPELSEEEVRDEAVVAPEVLLPAAPPALRRRDALLVGVVVSRGDGDVRRLAFFCLFRFPI